jgi:phage tail-like protein
MKRQEHRPQSRLLRHLPAVYQEPEEAPRITAHQKGPKYEAPFLQHYLLPYERLLLGGYRKEDRPGLEQVIELLYTYIHPRDTPREFLPWLAQWVALAVRADIPEECTRNLIANLIPLYRIRGTKKYLEKILALVLQVPATIVDDFPPLQVARHSRVGHDTFIGGGPTNYFRVTLRFRSASGREVERQRRLAEYVIELSKPAHTQYSLEMTLPRFQVGRHARIGVDTFL